jgi:hypothetical protein
MIEVAREMSFCARAILLVSTAAAGAVLPAAN